MQKSSLLAYCAITVLIALGIINLFGPARSFGATILQTQASDSLSTFRTNTNTNFTNVNDELIGKFGTTSANYWASLGLGFSTTSADYWGADSGFATFGYPFSSNATSTNITFSGGITGDLTGNADTATALAANGTNCSAGSYALGVDASGDAEGCTSTAGFATFGYPFPSNATSTALTFDNGITLGAGLTINASNPFIQMSDTDTGADAFFGGNFSDGSMGYWADYNNDQPGSLHMWSIDGGADGNTMRLSSSALYPTNNDGLTLGILNTNAWADLLLASGGTINWNNSDVTLTHTAGNLTLSSNDRFNATFATTSVLSAGTLCLTGDTCITSWPSGGSSFSYPFPNNATTSALGLYASTTIGNGTLSGGLTISGGATTTGLHIFSGGLLASQPAFFTSSLSIPNGSNPTVDTAGEIALDTTGNQLIVATSTNASYPAVFMPFITMSAGHATSSWSGTTTQLLAPAPGAGRFTTAQCDAISGTTVGVSLYDGTNRLNYFTASSTVGTITFTTNTTFTSGEPIRVDFGGPSGSPTQVACRFKYVYDRL